MHGPDHVEALTMDGGVDGIGGPVDATIPVHDASVMIHQ
jgi:hypothetical protein